MHKIMSNQQMQYRDVNLGNKKPFLIFQQIQIAKAINNNNSNNNIDAMGFAVSTVDKCIFIISTVGTSLTVLDKFVVPSPATALYYTAHHNVLIVGCADGTLCEYHCKTRKLIHYSHHDLQSGSSKCQNAGTDREQYAHNNGRDNKNEYNDLVRQQYQYQILCVYLKDNIIFAFTLNSEVLLVSQQTKQALNRIRFPADITAALVIDNEFGTNPIACISFANNRPPFLFNSTKPTSLLESYKLATRTHQQNEEIIYNQVSIMTYSTKNTNKIVCCMPKIEGDQLIPHKSHICVFVVQDYGQYKLSHLDLILELDIFPIFMHLKQDYLTLCSLTSHKVYNLTQRVHAMSFKAQNINWCFLIAHHLIPTGENLNIFMISKGVNIWAQEIRKNYSEIHIIQVFTN